MGGTACKGAPNSNKAIAIAILGLDNAGKTTTARALEKTSADSVTPTVGYSRTEITHQNKKIQLIDLGGAKSFREVWRHYYDDAYGFVYVLDSSEEDRLGENRDVLKRLLQEEKVKGKPILILANKQDKAEALDKNAIMEDLRIERLANENQTLCRVELCTAKALSRNGKNSKMDESIRHGFDWLIKTIYEHFDTLNSRVEQDVQKRNEAEQIEKRERQERIKKLREERDKEEDSKDDNDEDEETIKNGFIPIENAVKNAERNSSEKTTKDKSNGGSSSEKLKPKTYNEHTSLPPIPAPRSSSHNRRIISDENSEDQEHSRRHSVENSPRRKESPLPRSVSSNLDENQRNDSADEPTTNRTVMGKKKKVIGASRHRLLGDSLPPLAPSSASSRRDDFTHNKGPPVGTPRPPALVAQWAITSPSPHSTAEKLTTITSDNEFDDEDEGKRYKSLQPNKRSTSPHPLATNRITYDSRKPLTTNYNLDDNDNENFINNNFKNASRHKLHKDTNKDDIDENTPRKSRSKLKNDEDDDETFSDNRKKSNAREQERFTKQRHDKSYDGKNENYMEDDDYTKLTRSKRQNDLKTDNDDNDGELANNRRNINLREQDRVTKQRFDRTDDDNNENSIDNDYKKLSRHKLHHDLSKDDEDDDENTARKSLSKFNNNENDDIEFGDSRKKSNGREQDRFTKPSYDRNYNGKNKNSVEDDYPRLSRSKRQNDFKKKNNDDDDDDDDDQNRFRRPPSGQKLRSKVYDDNDDVDEIINNRKKTNSREQDPYSKQRFDRTNDNDDDFNLGSSRRTPSSSSARKTAGGDFSHRSHLRTDDNLDDD